DLLDRHPPGVLVLLSLRPPFLLGCELLDADRFGLGVGLVARRVGMLVVPDRVGWLALGKEKQVGLDAGVGAEDAVGQANDGVQVALVEQLLLDPGLHTLAEECAVRQDDTGAAAGLE